MILAASRLPRSMQATPRSVCAAGIGKPRGRKPRWSRPQFPPRLDGRKQDVLLLPVRSHSAIHQHCGRTRCPHDEDTTEDLGRLSSEAGAAEFGVIRSVLSTARKQRWNILRTLTANPSSLIADLRVA